MEHTTVLFTQLAIVLGLSVAFGFLIKQLKLPLLVAYLLVGVFLSLFAVFDLSTSEALTFLPEIGIAFVLFFIGMELDLKEIRNLGKPIIVAGGGQIIFSIIAGFLIALTFGFSEVEGLLLGVGLSFSSTIVVVKLLLEKKDLTSLYGKLSIGILLLEDLVAIFILMAMSVGSSLMNLGIQNSLPLLTLFVKGGLLFGISLYLSRHVLERVFRAAAASQELLFLSALAWCFLFVSLAIFLGFSVVIGAFLAGVALANSPFHLEIQGKVKPVRDFFVTIFFVYLGSQVVFTNILSVMPMIMIFTFYALIIKPLIFLLLLGLFGFRRHTLFQTSINLSQISEFSLIILVVGLKTGSASQEALTAMALTGVLSIIASSVLISRSRQIYKILSPFIRFFEHGSSVHQAEAKYQDGVIDDHVVLIGAHRVGGEILRFLRREKIPVIVLDFNPRVIQTLVENNIHALYGDVSDPEVLEFLNLEKARLVICTAQDLDDNLMLLIDAKRRKLKTVVITRASSVNEAEILYKAGSDYVILPEVVSGDYIVDLLKNHWPSLKYFEGRSEIELNRLFRNHLAVE